MAFRRSFAPAIANSANVKGLPNDQSEDLVDGTVKSNKVAEADLRFWIPLAAPLLREGVQRVQTFEELLKLPKAHIGHVLAIILPIYRQKRKVNGKRCTNASLKLKVEAWQRVIRGVYNREYNRAILANPNTPVKTFNVYSDPQLRALAEALDIEMRKSASQGITSGVQKRKRDNDLRPIGQPKKKKRFRTATELGLYLN